MSDQKTELKRRIQTMLSRMAEKMVDGDAGRVIAHGADAVADMVKEDLGPAGEEASRAEKELIADTGSTYGGQAHQLLQVATCSSTRRCTPAAADTDATESDFCGALGVATSRQLSAAHGSLGQSNGKATVTDMTPLAWMKVGDISARAIGAATSLRARGFLTIDSPPRSAHQERRPRCLAS
jgi:hypothetical protein